MAFRISTTAAARALAIATLVALAHVAAAQTAVLTSVNNGVLNGLPGGAAFVYPNVNFSAGSCPESIPVNPVTGFATGYSGYPGRPQGIGFYGSDFALVSSPSRYRVDNIRLSTASVLNTVWGFDVGWNGSGSIAVAPNLEYAVAAFDTKVYLLAAPFTAISATTTTLPGEVGPY